MLFFMLPSVTTCLNRTLFDAFYLCNFFNITMLGFDLVLTIYYTILIVINETTQRFFFVLVPEPTS